jgi:uncharacterized membrane protein YraQ (UPF0718 family)
VLAGLLAFVAIAVAGLTWAKWSPYAARVATISSTHAYPGSSILETAGPAHGGPSLAGGWDFTVAYFKAVWQALVAALLIAAAVQALVPRGMLTRPLSGRLPTVGGGLYALPSMMCSCCTAPVTTSLRRDGASVPGTLAYWIGNPVLNPAVIVFMALLLPWQWVATRLLAGALLVFGVTLLVARVAGPAPVSAAALAAEAPEEAPRPALLRYVRALARLTVVLVPEYLVVVFAVGALRGWLFPLDDGLLDVAVLGAIVAAVAGTLVVIPTGGEIPILTGLAAAGAGAGVVGALLIVLPAICLPSMVMVAGALGWRATTAMAAGVCLTGLFAGGLLVLLGG